MSAARHSILQPCTSRLLIVRLIGRQLLLGTAFVYTPEPIERSIERVEAAVNNIFRLTSAVGYSLTALIGLFTCGPAVRDRSLCSHVDHASDRLVHAVSIGLTLDWSCLMYLTRCTYTDWTAIEPDTTTGAMITGDSISAMRWRRGVCIHGARVSADEKFCHVCERRSVDIERWRNLHRFVQRR